MSKDIKLEERLEALEMFVYAFKQALSIHDYKLYMEIKHELEDKS